MVRRFMGPFDLFTIFLGKRIFLQLPKVTLETASNQRVVCRVEFQPGREHNGQ